MDNNSYITTNNNNDDDDESIYHSDIGRIEMNDTTNKLANEDEDNFFSNSLDDPNNNKKNGRGNYNNDVTSMEPNNSNTSDDDDNDASRNNKEENNNDDSHAGTEELSEDVYSLIFISKYKSASFIFALVVFCFQFSLTTLILTDLISGNPTNNPLGVPHGVTFIVTIAQGFSMVLATAYQDDIIEGLLMFHRGYSQFNKQFDYNNVIDIRKINVSSTIKQSLRGKPFQTTCFKWFLASLLQFLSGCMLLVVIFILTMQSSSVLGMMLNFAALLFVSEIDNVAFAMAKHGFVTNSVQREANNVTNYTIPCCKAKLKSTNKCRRMLFLGVVSGLIIGYAIIVHQQRSGKFLPQSVGVQFDDEYDRVASDFSGVYIKQNDKHFNGRVYYKEQQQGLAMLAYCDEQEAWTFTRWAEDTKVNRKWFPNNDIYIKEDPCKWFAKSSPTKEYDVMNVADGQWYAYFEKIKQPKPFKSFTMWNNDCSSDEGNTLCHKDNGQCINNKCVCNEGNYGLNCEYSNVCTNLVIDKRRYKFPSDMYATNLELLTYPNGTAAEVYNRGVYVNSNTRDGLFINIIAFVGYRWFSGVYSRDVLTKVLATGKSADGTPLLLMEDLANFFPKNIHSYYGPLATILEYNAAHILYISESIEVGSVKDTYTPIGVRWFDTKAIGVAGEYADEAQPIDTLLICGRCSDKNPCFNSGTCNNDGVCDCPIGFSGSLCEKQESCDSYKNDTFSGCFNNGTCNNGKRNDGTCSCPGSFYGRLCQLDFFGESKV